MMQKRTQEFSLEGLIETTRVLLNWFLNFLKAWFIFDTETLINSTFREDTMKFHIRKYLKKKHYILDIYYKDGKLK